MYQPKDRTLGDTTFLQPYCNWLKPVSIGENQTSGGRSFKLSSSRSSQRQRRCLEKSKRPMVHPSPMTAGIGSKRGYRRLGRREGLKHQVVFVNSSEVAGNILCKTLLSSLFHSRPAFCLQLVFDVCIFFQTCNILPTQGSATSRKNLLLFQEQRWPNTLTFNVHSIYPLREALPGFTLFLQIRNMQTPSAHLCKNHRWTAGQATLLFSLHVSQKHSTLFWIMMIYAALPGEAVDYILTSSLHDCHGTDGVLCAHVHHLAQQA